MFYQNCWLDTEMKQSLEEGRTYNDDMFQADLKRVNAIMEKEDDDD